MTVAPALLATIALVQEARTAPSAEQARVLPTSVPAGEDGTRSPRDPPPFPDERFTWLREPLAGWTEVSSPTTEYRVPDEITGGVVFFDADGDGDLDLFLVNGGTWPDLQPDAPFPGHALFRNELAPNAGQAGAPSKPWTFTNVARDAGVFGEAGAYCMGATAADVDGDGDQDLFVTGLARCWLYRNDGVRDGIPRFTERAGELGVRGDGKWATSAAFLDADRDGRIDLYVARYLDFSIERNRKLACGVASSGVRDYCGPKDFDGVQDAFYLQQPDGTFRECAIERGLAAPQPLSNHAKGLGVVACDVEDDGDMDLYVANDLCPNLLFVNDGTGKFAEEALVRGCALNEEGRSQAGMGVDAGDYDGDGDFDFVVTNLDLEMNSLFKNDGSGGFTDVVRRAGLAAGDQGEVGFGADFFDADDDGDLDLAIANGHVLAHIHKTRGTLFYEQAGQLFENDKGRFKLLPAAQAGAWFGVRNVARGLASGDLDDDGDLDLVVVVRDEPAVLLRNQHVEKRAKAAAAGGAATGRRSDAILLELVGTKSVRDAIGARVWMKVGERTIVEEVRAGSSFLSRCDLRLHFGLGAASQAESIRVRWPSGGAQGCGPLDAGFVYRLTEGGGLEKVRELGAK